jgi:hypothetical protein
VRSVAERRPASGAETVAPNLEDAYVWLMSRSEPSVAAA